VRILRGYINLLKLPARMEDKVSFAVYYLFAGYVFVHSLMPQTEVNELLLLVGMMASFISGVIIRAVVMGENDVEALLLGAAFTTGAAVFYVVVIGPFLLLAVYMLYPL
jgi:hypothetical protein